MVQGWVTLLVLAFGIVIAVICVIAYLRMFRKDRLDSRAQSAPIVSPPRPKYPAAAKDNGQSPEAVSEQAMRQD
ncbi:hypothetical protein FHS15_003243 [Paenibacillus castaneae]|uniref:hypothetical protein n=1 Tax=Paenibacillus castaneae TaxID=474957 RepID=UPI000C9A102F|nr:hypothetical protein [Paenibacillus castaneae]NIK78105.1 hypothetical protein [Paenibacillus castaneae]